MLQRSYLHASTEGVPMCSIGDAPRKLPRLVHVQVSIGIHRGQVAEGGIIWAG